MNPVDVREHAVYLHRDSDASVLYVGCSVALSARTKAHAYSSPWWPDVASIEVESTHTERSDALARERELIRLYEPANNKVDNPGTDWERWRDESWGNPHGTDSHYGSGCRCDECREAHRVAAKARRDVRAADTRSGWLPVPHGTTNAYANYGCRCTACRDANRAARKASLARACPA